MDTAEAFDSCPRNAQNPSLAQDPVLEHKTLCERPGTDAISKDDVDFYEDATEYLTGWKLFMIVFTVTLVAFLIFLDSSIIVTYTFLVFLAVFELGSLICGVAASSKMLISGRAVAGLGAAGLLNGGLAIVTASVPVTRRPALFGIILSVSQLGTVFGPLVGGGLTQHLSWRWCFYINLPAGGVVAVLLLAVRIPQKPLKEKEGYSLRQTLGSLDLFGAILFAPTVIMLLLALQWGGQTYTWHSATVIGLFVGSFANFLAFLAWEHYMGSTAMIPLRMLKQKSVYSSCLMMLFIMGQLIVTIYYLPIWFQVVKAESPVRSGVDLLPMILPHVFFATTSGILVGRFGQLLPSAAISGILLSIGSGLLTTFKPESDSGLWIGAQILIGSGRGCGFQIPLLAVQNALPATDAAIATSLVIFCQYFGGAVFSSVAETILINGLKEYVPEFAPNADLQSVIYTGASSVRDIVAGASSRGVILAYNRALVNVFYLATAGSIAAFFCCLGIRWQKAKRNTTVASEL